MRLIHILASRAISWGGPPVAAAGLMEIQVRQGHDVICIAVSRLGEQVVPVRGAHVIDIARSGWQFLPARSRKLGTVLRHEMAKADIVHIHELWHHAHWAAARAAKKARIPYVVTIHGQLAPFALAQKRWKKRLGWLTYQRRILQGAACIHAITERERTDVISMGLRSPVRVIPNGVPTGNEAARPRMPVSLNQPSKRTILFLGRIHPIKGIDLLFDALSELRDLHCRLVIAGSGSKAFTNRLRALGTKRGLSLVWAGMLGAVDKQAAFRAADVFVLPSRSEGFSMSVLEAMVAGVPVVITNECNFPAVADQRLGWVVPVDATRLAAAIRDALTDRKKARACAFRARAFVNQNLTWTKIGAQVTNVYSQIVTSREGIDVSSPP